MALLMDVLSNVALGLNTALTPIYLFYCFVGVFLGTLFGIIPGIGALSAISLLFPLTFYLDPAGALIMLAGIWYGTTYGGSTASILLNLPGTPANAVACLDGYPMAKQGRGGVALLITTIASFVGGSVGIILMMVFAPTIANYALNFGSAEYFALILLGLIASSTVSPGSVFKGLAMITLGLALGSIGLDIYSYSPRFTFNLINLEDGLSLVVLAMGLFGVAEIISSARKTEVHKIDRKSTNFAAMRPTREDTARSWAPMLRGSGIGAFFGALPGVGPSIAAFVAYAVERRISPRREEFGRGAIEGVAAPEASNNASDQTSFIPTMALGVPGSATMALLLGVLIIHGITPGPKLVSEQPELFWGLVMSFWIGNVLLVILNIPMIGLWVRILLVPYHLLYPVVLVFICIGVFTVANNPFDIWMVALIGLLGYALRILHFATAPVLLGFVLGPLLEEHFRRAMLLSRGDPATFIERPVSATILAIAALLLAWGTYTSIRDHRRPRRAQEQ